MTLPSWPQVRWQVILRVAGEYTVIGIGAILVALGTNLFLIPNQVVSGGVTGIAIILHYLFDSPVGLVVLAFNVPLFLAGMRWGGGISIGIRTAFAVIVMSLAIDLSQPYIPEFTTDPLLYTIYGGIVDGLGLGLVLRFQGTTGGTDIIARLVKRFLGVNYGTTLLACNVAIIGSAGFLFGPEPAMYAIVLAAISSKVIDLVQEGARVARSVIIVSGNPSAIRQGILEGLERGVTVLYGRGGYTDIEREVLLCAIQRNEVSRLKRIVHDSDPNAFVIIGSVHEVFGEGFQGIMPHS